MQIFEGQIRFGIHAGQQNISFADYLDIWRTAEVLGYDWASVYDHFQPIKSDPSGSCFEALAMVVALAAHTKRIRCGILVVNNSYRNPAVLAKIAATIDHISNERLELGIGSGWVKSEHDQYGIAFPPTGSRIRMLGESAKILKSLWTEYRTTLQGRYYTITDAVCEPKPVQKPHIPLWIGGMGGAAHPSRSGRVRRRVEHISHAPRGLHSQTGCAGCTLQRCRTRPGRHPQVHYRRGCCGRD